MVFARDHRGVLSIGLFLKLIGSSFFKAMAKGFLYILQNSAMPGLLKIGFSIKVPTERLDELFTTGVPEPFKLIYYCLVDDAAKVESLVHQKLSSCRPRKDREFFRVDVHPAIKTIAGLCSPEHEWKEGQSTTSSGIKRKSQAIERRCPLCGAIYVHRDTCTKCRIRLI